MTKHENDIYLIAGRYALVKGINGRKSPMRSASARILPRRGIHDRPGDSFISRLHQFLLGLRTLTRPPVIFA